MRGEQSEPILPSRDLNETRAFYAKLGFRAWFGENAPWQYEIVSRGGLTVHFFLDRDLDPAKSSSGCYWRVLDADKLHSEFAALALPAEGIPRLTAPEDKNWWMREFTLVDPSGNLMRVGHELHQS